MNLFDSIGWVKKEDNLVMVYHDNSTGTYIEWPGFLSQEGLENYKQVEKLFVGRNTGMAENCVIYSNTVIGRYCSIGHYCQIGGMSHRMDHLSTGCLDEAEMLKFGVAMTGQYDSYTRLGCDVWLGGNVIILRGLEVGHGACIGAGAVVTKDVPPYAVVAGNPARVIRYRFPQDIIDQLLELEWWTLEPEIIKQLPYHDIELSIKEIKRIRSGAA